MIKDSPATGSAQTKEAAAPVRKLLEVKREVEPDWMRREDVATTVTPKPMDSHHAVYRMSAEEDALVYHRRGSDATEFLLYSA